MANIKKSNAQKLGILACVFGLVSIFNPVFIINLDFVIIPIGLTLSILAYRYGAKAYGVIGLALNLIFIIGAIFFAIVLSNPPPGI